MSNLLLRLLAFVVGFVIAVIVAVGEIVRTTCLLIVLFICAGFAYEIVRWAVFHGLPSIR